MLGLVLSHIENTQESWKYSFLWLDYNDFGLNIPSELNYTSKLKKKNQLQISLPKKYKLKYNEE